MRVFHFVGPKHGLDDLRERRLKIATFNDLNDPFELLGPSSVHKDKRRRFQALKDQLAINRGMLCFSRNWKNPVQWSHYAEKHRGLCLGFEILKKYLTPVRYKETRIEPNICIIEKGGSLAQKEILKVLSTKYSHWHYENEMRLFTAPDERDKNGFYFCSFSESLALKEVIVGHSSTITRQKLRDALGDLAARVAVYKARLSFRAFTVVRQRNERLWQ